MSLPVTTTTDYTSGSVKISTTRFGADDLTTYITEWEQKYIKLLLNGLMFSEIRDQSPLHTKYTALINGVDWLDDDGDTHVLRGLKEALTRFVYYHFGRDYFLATVIGKGRNLNENATNLTAGENQQVVNSRFNEGVNMYDECLDFVSFYQDVEGSITNVVEAPAGTYTVDTPSTLYLDNGDTVTINNVDYVTSSLIVNTSFVITGDAGLDLGDSYTYEPFDEPNLTILKMAWL